MAQQRSILDGASPPGCKLACMQGAVAPGPQNAAERSQHPAAGQQQPHSCPGKQAAATLSCHSRAHIRLLVAANSLCGVYSNWRGYWRGFLTPYTRVHLRRAKEGSMLADTTS